MAGMYLLTAYLVIGAFAGTAAGLLGIGGGLIVVPFLAWTFEMQGFPPEFRMQLAVGTSLATIVVTSVSSVVAHHRRHGVLWPVFARLLPGVMLGALFGAVVADALPGRGLRLFFGVFVLLAAAQIGFSLRPGPHRALPGPWSLASIGGLIGAVSALVGIGGGTMTVPFLVWCQVQVRQAVGTSSAVGLPIAVAGAAGFVITGASQINQAWSLGYVYLPAFAGIVTTSVVFAAVGAKLAHRLPTRILRRVFAVFLAVVGLSMLSG